MMLATRISNSPSPADARKVPVENGRQSKHIHTMLRGALDLHGNCKGISTIFIASKITVSPPTTVPSMCDTPSKGTGLHTS